MQPDVLLLAAPAQPLLLAAWSVTTPAYVRYSNVGKPAYRPPQRRGVDNSNVNRLIGWSETCEKARLYKELGV